MRIALAAMDGGVTIALGWSFAL